MKKRWDVDRYIRECNRFQWRVIAIAVGTVLFMLACFALMIPFRDQVRHFVSAWYGAPTAEIVVGLTPFPSVIVLFASLFWLPTQIEQTHRRFELPGLQEIFGGMRHLVVATKCARIVERKFSMNLVTQAKQNVGCAFSELQSVSCLSTQSAFKTRSKKRPRRNCRLRQMECPI